MRALTLKRPSNYGWVMVFTLAITELVSWGVTYYAFSVLLPPMQRELGWTSAQLTGAFSLGLLISGISDVWVGRWLDMRGPRLLMTLGSITAVLLVLAWSQVNSLVALYAIWVGIGLVAPMIQYAPAFWVAAKWFDKRRGLALTVLTFGGGLASTVFIPLTNALMLAYGWRAALMGLAGILAALTILPHALLLRGMPDVTRSRTARDSDRRSPTPKLAHDVLRQRTFWLLTLAFALSTMAFNGMAVNLFAFETARGQDATFVAWAAGLTGVLQVFGRLTLAPLSDRISRRAITLFLFACQAIGFVCLLALPMQTGLLAYVVFRGIGNGTLTPIRAALLADVYGTERYGSINGAMSFGVGLAGATAPLAVSALAGVGGYASVLGVFVVTSLLAGVAIVLAYRKA
ncbi:MAG: MFS transporter [Anaerolineae bacterium]|nr:MFS transporter [Anaerolineae bacterium]